MSQRIKVIDPADKNGKLKTKFRHVAGLHEAKQEIKVFRI
jgi:hypothetical protein